MIKVTDLHKKIGQVQALNGLSFAAHNGTITGLLGPNGAGKTTCLRTLFGLLKADSGAKDDKGQKLVSAGLLFLLALGVFSGFGFMFTAITTEKQNRVTEQLLTLLTPQQWMDGKILGISLFCLKSMLTSGLFFFLVIQAFRLIDNKPMQSIPMTGFEVFSALLFVGLGLLLVNSFMAGFAANCAI